MRNQGRNETVSPLDARSLGTASARGRNPRTSAGSCVLGPGPDTNMRRKSRPTSPRHGVGWRMALGDLLPGARGGDGPGFVSPAGPTPAWVRLAPGRPGGRVRSARVTPVVGFVSATRGAGSLGSFGSSARPSEPGSFGIGDEPPSSSGPSGSGPRRSRWVRLSAGPPGPLGSFRHTPSRPDLSPQIYAIKQVRPRRSRRNRRPRRRHHLRLERNPGKKPSVRSWASRSLPRCRDRCRRDRPRANLGPRREAVALRRAIPGGTHAPWTSRPR
jgi:hypothetical protein